MTTQPTDPQPALAESSAPSTSASNAGIAAAVEASSTSAPAPTSTQSDPPPPRNPKLGIGLFLAGALGTFFLMSLDVPVFCGPLWGTLGMLVAAAGVLEFCGLLRARPTDARPNLLAALPGEPGWMALRTTLPLAVGVTAVGGLLGGPDSLPLLLLFGLLLLLFSAVRRPALFVFVSASLLLLPMLGGYGLWDPWETHYGEVAREILARDDWITLWWAQDEWFRSKPILIFWIEALFWGALGIPFSADSNPGHPEWAIRLPHYVLTMGALMACYAAMARNFGRRTAVLAALVLATTPYFFLLAHQAITDMPFVATMTIALAMFMIAAEEAPDATVRRYRVGPFAVSAQSVLLAGFVLVALPQALYLLTRNLTFVVDQKLFSLHFDSFLFGSAGNSGIPGNPVNKLRGPYLTELWYQPMAQGILWLLGLGTLVWMLMRERRSRHLAMFAFYLFCSLAWMAKGIPGFALPGLIVALYLLATGRWSLLLSGSLRVGAGILTIAVTGLPWYVAMYGRLGPFFTDRLLIHDHINRLAQGVHGDTGSIQYFLWQLGYGAFPWIGLAPLAVVAWLYLVKADGEAGARERRSALLLSLWATTSFALFNAMITKFHHYIFPAVPPISLLVGLVLERALGPAADAARERRGTLLCAAGALALVLALGGVYGDLRGVIPADVSSAERASWIAQHGWSTGASVAVAALGVVALFMAFRLLRPAAEEGSRSDRAVLGIALLASAVTVAFAGRDLSWSLTERPLGHERLIQLFIYSYGRPFPDYLDYRPILSGFAMVAFGMLVLAGVSQMRKIALYGLLATTFWFSAWALNVYLIDLTPHWGQRELVKRYYEERSGANEPLIAWQMNWKGENIYTGNRVHVFVQLDNKAITKWMEQHPNTRAYFVLEHSRLGNFKRMLGPKRKVEELSTARDNNKFLLVRAEI